jgi:hypothetical protein
MKQEIEEGPLSKEIGRVLHKKRYWIFYIIFVAELLRAPESAFWKSLLIFLISYAGSLLFDPANRIKALYALGFGIYFLMTLR